MKSNVETTPTFTNMKRYLQIATATLGVAVLGLLMNSCSGGSPGGSGHSSGTHQMGAPGKARVMSDSVMPGRAR